MRFRKKLLLCIGLVALACLAATACLVVDGLTDEIHPADVALVLGNKVDPNGRPSARLQARLDRAWELWESGVVPAVIVSGGTGKEGFDEAKVMAAYLQEKGIPTEKIILDSQGITTEASAKNTASIMRERNLHSVLVVTQYFHIPRTKLAMRKEGIDPVYSAHARFFEPRDFYSIPREMAGYVSYYFR